MAKSNHIDISNLTPVTPELADRLFAIRHDGTSWHTIALQVLNIWSNVYFLYATTTDNTPGELFLDRVSERLEIPADTSWAYSILIVGRRADANNESAGYKIEGVIDNNADTVALVGIPANTVLAEDSIFWNAITAADNVNKSLGVYVVGETGKTIQWVARVTLVEITA